MNESVLSLDLAVEDELTERGARRLLEGRFEVRSVYGLRGFGYLKSKAKGWNRAARGWPLLLIADLDQAPCASGLQQDWLKPDALHPNLLFRVAVREIEAWLLADWDCLLGFLEVPKKKSRHLTAPASTEELPDPKGRLVELARMSSRREIRERVAPRPDSTAKQGPEYNQCLAPLVDRDWSATRAARRNDSLRRTMSRLESFRPRR